MALTAAEKADQLVAVSNSLRFVPPNAEWTDYDTSKSSLWRQWRLNFPRPRRRQLTRVFKGLVLTWVALVTGLYDRTLGSMTMLAINTLLFVPGAPPLKMAIIAGISCLGLVMGMLCICLGQLWLVLYNNSGGTDPYIRALIIELWLIFVVWTTSAIQFKYINGLLGGMAFYCLVIMLILVIGGEDFTTLDRVPIEAQFRGVFIPALIVQGFALAIAIFIFPESDNEGTRESALKSVRSMRTALVNEIAEANNNPAHITNIDEKGTNGSNGGSGDDKTSSYLNGYRAFLYARMYNDIADLTADSKGCLMDIGLQRDVPARTFLLARAIQNFSRHVQHGVRSEAIVKTLEAVHDALIVEKKWYQPSFWNYSTDEPFSKDTDASVLVEEARIELEKERNALLARANDITTVGRKELDVFYLSMALDDADKLIEAAQSLLASRNSSGLKFYYLGRPGKESLPPAPKKTKAEKPPKPARKWKPGLFAFDILYVFQSALASDAARFGFKRALAWFLCSVWAFLPSTAEYYVAHNIHWILVSVVLLMTPTLGAGVIKSAFRLLATGFAILWSYFAWLASGAKGTDEETTLRIVLGFYAPLSIAAIYTSQVMPRPYLGKMMAICYAIVALGGSRNPELMATFGAERAQWLVVSVIGTFFLQIAVFPILSSTDSRVGLGNILYGVDQMLRGVETGAETKSELTSLQTRLTVLRLGSLRDAAGEPDLDRPWDLKLAVAISGSMQKLIQYLSGLVDYRALAGPPPRWFDELVDEAVWKIHTLAMALVTKKPLPRLPKLEMNKFGEDALGTAQGQKRVVVAGGGAAFQEMLAELDVLKELIGRMYGKEVVAGEVNESMVDGTRRVWLDHGQVAVLEPRRVRAIERGGLDL